MIALLLRLIVCIKNRIFKEKIDLERIKRKL